MKRTLLAIVAAFVMITSANAQRLTDIQAEARFITDKMIVELGLNSVQRNSLLNINLNYLDGIRSYRDIDAYGWHYRNRQLKRMLTARQWKRFKEAYYFYHPIGWNNNTYIYNIYIYISYSSMHSYFTLQSPEIVRYESVISSKYS